MPDWLSTYTSERPDDDDRPPAPTPPRQQQRPVVACPECGSIDIRIRDRKASATYLSCNLCDFPFRLGYRVERAVIRP